MTQAAFVAVLAAAKEEPLPEVFRRTDVREARSTAARSQTPYGAVHCKVQAPRLEGDPFELVVCSPWAMLYYAASTSVGFANLLRQVMARKGPSTPGEPYKICIYADEVTPGDQVGGKHTEVSS